MVVTDVPGLTHI